MDGESQDKRVTSVDTLSFQFCLRFPQHELDVASKMFTLLSTPLSKRNTNSGMSRSLGACFSALSAPNTTPPHTPTKSTTGGTGLTSPAMKLFISTTTNPTKIKRGCFGPLTFLDSQTKFNATFGLNPRMLPANRRSKGPMRTPSAWF